MKISLQRTIAALTGALDFVGIDEVHHGKRVALIAYSIAKELDWPEPRRRDVFYAGMLHDCGVSRTREHRDLTEILEWAGAQNHCLRGERYLLECPPLSRYASIVRWHHTRWESLCTSSLSEQECLNANLIFLADRIDTLLTPYVSAASLRNEILCEYPGIVSRVAELAGSLFSPLLVEAFRRASEKEAFWLQVDPSYISDEIEEHLKSEVSIELDSADALAIAGLFARTVDSKSTYTLEHSTRVARIARYLAAAIGIEGENLAKIEIAALLHDIGKLRVPEQIIDKPSPISADERAIVKRHSYDTGRILKKVFPGQPIADWASMHHENLLGTGYPSHLIATNISREARLIEVADIFQALSQDRPYRAKLTCAGVMSNLHELCSQGRLDAEMVELADKFQTECYSLATSL